MSIYQPYTYLIGWSTLNTWYYGLRFGKNCNPKELWKTYFTSSWRVTQFREYNGEPDIVEIRKTFNNKEKAGIWEHKVLRRMKVIKDTKWLNKTNNIAIINDEEMCKYIGRTTGQKLKGQTKSKAHSINISKAKQGIKPKLTIIQEQKRKNNARSSNANNKRKLKISNSIWINNNIICKRININSSIPDGWYKGRIITTRKPHSIETKMKMSIKAKNRHQSLIFI